MNSWKPCFLLGPPRGYVTRNNYALQSSEDIHLLKLQRLQNRVLRVIGNLDRCTPVRELHMVFKIPYGYDYITKLWRTQA
jgi:hypothetical protein